MVITATQLKNDFADATGQVQHGGRRIVVCRNGKEAFAMVPIADLRLLEALEDKVDLIEAEKSLADPRASIPWEEAKKEIG